jgi:hypothetical protein
MPNFEFDSANLAHIQKTFRNNFKLRLFLLRQIPFNYLAGIRVKSLDENRCEVTVPHKWLNQNPFRSTFWAVLGMAAELASGALVTMYTYKLTPSISMLVGHQTGTFHKKAVGKTRFVCESGPAIKAAVIQAATTSESVTIECPVQGFNEANELICEFTFSWSMKARSKK